MSRSDLNAVTPVRRKDAERLTRAEPKLLDVPDRAGTRADLTARRVTAWANQTNAAKAKAKVRFREDYLEYWGVDLGGTPQP